jgi:TPR repeat protein
MLPYPMDSTYVNSGSTNGQGRHCKNHAGDPGKSCSLKLSFSFSFYRGRVMAAICFKNGQSVDKDVIRAAEYYRLSADQGNASAQYRFGLCLELGKGVEKNLNLAAEYRQKAVSQGFKIPS